MDKFNETPITDSGKIKSQEQFMIDFELLFYLLGGSF